MVLLSIRNIGKTFQSNQKVTTGLQRLSLDIEQGELITLLGPSGCGKTTALRCIAGLETPDRGSIELDGKVLFTSERPGKKPEVDIPPENRGMAMVFQNYALWPHMDVFNNVAFGLQRQRLSRSEISVKVEQALRNVQLWDHRDKKVSQLSGGQQQRVAIARAMAPDPKLILFDEPLSNMDTQLRENMRLEILELQEKMGLTTIWVTHDQEEALGMSSRIVLINEGRVEQIGTPAELWKTPATGFAASFIGTTNRLVGTVVFERSGLSQGLALSMDDETKILLPDEAPCEVGDRVSIYIRTGALSIVDFELQGAPGVWRAQFVTQTFHGDYTLVVVSLGNLRISFRNAKFLDQPPNFLYIYVNPSDIMYYQESQAPAEALSVRVE